MSAVVVHSQQSLRYRLAWAAAFCVAVNLGFLFFFPTLDPPIVTTAHLLSELVPPFVHGLQEAVGIIRSAASK